MSDWQIPAEGEVLADKYRIERILGQGGMGVVVLATHVALEQRVAIKFLLPEATQHPEVVERFAREARAAARMQGQHVVRVIDVSTLEDGRTYMVMEYLEGRDLEGVLDAHGALPLEEVLGYLEQALEALAEAHAKGIVHRDLKPGNLFLASTADGGTMVKVLDFGISKLQDDKVALTRTATAMGTAYYMSPEQLTNAKDVDERADIWSLGVMVYELLSNQRPYDGESMPEIVAKILRNQPPPLSSLGLGIPPEFDEVFSRCVASEREQRFADVGELAEALVAFLPGFNADRIVRVRNKKGLPPPPSRVLGSAPPSRVVSSAEPIGAAATQLAMEASADAALAPAPASPKRAALFAGVGLLTVGAFGAFWFARTEPPPPNPTVAASTALAPALPSAAASSVSPVEPTPSAPVPTGSVTATAPTASAPTASAPVEAAPTASSAATEPTPRPVPLSNKPSAKRPPAPSDEPRAGTKSTGTGATLNMDMK